MTHTPGETTDSRPDHALSGAADPGARRARTRQRNASDWSARSRLARDDLVGAELLLTREVVSYWGVLFETLDGLNDLALRQLRHFAEDQCATWRRVATEPGLHNVEDIVAAHLERRIAHLADGAREFAALSAAASGQAGAALFGLWRPLSAVLRDDWRRPGAPRDPTGPNAATDEAR